MSTSDPDPLQRWVDAGLFVPEDDHSGQRRELIAWLDTLPLGPDAFSGITADQLPLKVNRRMLQPGTRITADQAKQRSGVDQEVFDAVCRASGFAPDHAFTEDDLAAISAFTASMGLFTDDELLHFVRVLASSMGRVADAATALFRIDVSPTLDGTDASELEWALSNYEAIQLIEPLLVAARSFLLHELEVASERSDRARERIGETANTSTLRLAVGFVDLVGYTSMSADMNPDTLGHFIRQFETRAHEIVNEHAGRVVKLIGDEVMFVNLDPADACAAALALIDAFDDEEATPRGGIATGEVVARGGDYYGSVVNLAARIGAQAVTGEILIDQATSDDLRTEGDAPPILAVEPAGRRMLKGFADPVPLFSLIPS